MLVSLCQLQSVLSYCYLISSLESHCILCPVSLSLSSSPLQSLGTGHVVSGWTMQDCLLRYSILLLYLPQTAACSSLIHCKSAVLLLFTLLCLCLEESMMSSVLCFYQELRHVALAVCFYSGLWSEIRSYRTDEVSCKFLKSCGPPRELVFIIIKNMP